MQEKYWFQDIGGTIFNLDYVTKIWPTLSMSYAEKVNALVRMSMYIGLILSLYYSNYLFLYIPIVTMILTYILYLFRLDQLDYLQLKNAPPKEHERVMKNMMKGNNTLDLESVLNIKKCVKPSTNNPFMNPLVFDNRLRSYACDAVSPENQLEIEREYNNYCIKDASDIWNHNSGRRQFYTVASTTFPNDQGSFANWLYKRPATCKEGNGYQCIANNYTPLNRNLINP